MPKKKHEELNDLYEVELYSIQNTKSNKLELITSLQAYPVYANGTVVGFKEYKTGTPIVSRNVNNGVVEDVFLSKNNLNKNRIGDIVVKVHPLINQEKFVVYKSATEEDIEKVINNIDAMSLSLSCPGYQSDKPVSFYNQELYLVPLADGVKIIVTPIKLLDNVYTFKEVVTGKTVIQRRYTKIRTKDGIFVESYDCFISNDINNYERFIKEVDTDALATRLLSPNELEEYLTTSPSEIDKIITDFANYEDFREDAEMILGKYQ